MRQIIGISQRFQRLPLFHARGKEKLKVIETKAETADHQRLAYPHDLVSVPFLESTKSNAQIADCNEKTGEL